MAVQQLCDRIWLFTLRSQVKAQAPQFNLRWGFQWPGNWWVT